MMKAPPKLTTTQAKALEFIRTSLERSGTAPTLRELCAFMGYSAIGSSQDLVSALRRKGFLLTPDRQSARSLVLSPRAVALHEPIHQSTDSTYAIHCFERLPEGDPRHAQEERSCTLRMSTAMFSRPFPSPNQLFGLRVAGEGMIDAGVLNGDWVLVHYQKEADAGQIVVAKIGRQTFIKRLLKDRNGWYLRSENVAYPIVRATESEPLEIVGKVIALQRVMQMSESV
jgi:repressor LexA